MTGEDPDRDERELRALFDRTAEGLDGPGLTKLRARAADVPGLGRRRAWWWAFAPVLAVVAGALIVLFFRPGAHSGAERIASGTDSAVSVPQATSSAPSVIAREAPSETSDPNGDDDLDTPDTVADLAGVSDDDTPGNDLFAALDEPADEDVDAWLAATGAFLEGG